MNNSSYNLVRVLFSTFSFVYHLYIGDADKIGIISRSPRSFPRADQS